MVRPFPVEDCPALKRTDGFLTLAAFPYFKDEAFHVCHVVLEKHALQLINICQDHFCCQKHMYN